MSDEKGPEEGIRETGRDAEQELDELEREGHRMEERLDAASEHADEAEVPEPADASQPGVDESDVPEGEGESAQQAGQ